MTLRLLNVQWKKTELQLKHSLHELSVASRLHERSLFFVYIQWHIGCTVNFDGFEFLFILGGLKCEWDECIVGDPVKLVSNDGLRKQRCLSLKVLQLDQGHVFACHYQIDSRTPCGPSLDNLEPFLAQTFFAQFAPRASSRGRQNWGERFEANVHRVQTKQFTYLNTSWSLPSIRSQSKGIATETGDKELKTL